MVTQPNQQPNDWKEKLADQHWKLKLADFGVQIDKDMRRQAMVERLIKKTQDGTLDQETNEPMDKKLEDEMGVRIGDEIHYHNETTPPPTKNEARPPNPPTAPSLAKKAAAIGLATALGGAGLAAPIAAWNLTRQPDQTTVIEGGNDTDTRYGLRIYRDEQP